LKREDTITPGFPFSSRDYGFFIHFRQNNNKNYTKTEFGTVLEMPDRFF
jgi:hypothetical protein